VALPASLAAITNNVPKVSGRAVLALWIAPAAAKQDVGGARVESP